MGTDSTIEVSKNRRGKAGGAPNGNSNPLKHGLSTLKAATTKLGSHAIDGRSSLSYQLKKWRRELVNDLGGDEHFNSAVGVDRLSGQIKVAD